MIGINAFNDVRLLTLYERTLDKYDVIMRKDNLKFENLGTKNKPMNFLIEVKDDEKRMPFEATC